ncbi:PEGA domain-containing protein [Parahaliea sp. F7430]|uniref:PEGA domain-containing protein n=1 Tax=Sediminihaliea albiluteola TaxID=2758564 RepID=A0A7W2TTF2_9GAMM|nr:PEGA domain-containing protein [Sediminihaliea albiluteola]MBA6411657.1 PEGA domain-containing protein [Sediminihaliea albiluteola]
MSSPLESDKNPITPAAFEPLADSAGKARQGPKKQPLRWVFGLCALLFLLLMAFLLSARSLQITVEATTAAELEINAFYLPFGKKRLLIRPGDYELRVSAEGYQPLKTMLKVTDQDSQSLRLELQPLPGRLTLNSRPEGAEVYIDGELIANSPLHDQPITAGQHELLVKAPRYQSWQQTLAVEGRNQSQALQIDLLPAWAMVKVNSLPEGASIKVNGEPIANTPAELELLQGRQRLELELPGFSTYQQTLEITAGEAQELGTIELEAAAGLLVLSSTPTGANVTLDGDFQGQTPITLELKPQQAQRLSLSRPGYRRHSETITMAAGEQSERQVSLQPQLGEVALQISPAAAQISINGKVIGRGNQNLSLPTYEHSVEVSLEGYATVRKRITPRSGIKQRLNVSLQTQQEAKVAALRPEITTSLGQTLKLFVPAHSPLSEFTMGASRRDPGRRANEVLHSVRLKRMFYIQSTEVTNGQFRQFLASHNSGQVDNNSLNRDQQPVVEVSWQQAAQFCNWLSKREGLPLFYREREGMVVGFNPKATGYRLPSEAEWAWAARVEGETLKTFTWGEDFPPSKAVENYADSTAAYVTGRVIQGYTDGYVVSAPVASFPANHNGLYDLGGNVSEWVHDVYSIPSANSATSTDPLGSQSGENYVIRGANWSLSKLSELRLSYRDYGQAARDDVGFRIARYAE